PAPLFLFLAGISFALVTSKLVRKNATPGQVTRTMARRGAEIVGFGLLFRLQEYLIAWGWAPWTDLFRVDVLNIIGLSMIMMALLCGLVLQINASLVQPTRITAAQAGSLQQASNATRPVAAIALASVAVVVLIALATPPLYT